MRKITLLVAFALVGLVATTVNAGEKYKIGLCMASLDTFLSSMAQAAIDHANETGIVELTLVDAQDDTVHQTDQVTTLVENGVDALIINIVETTAAPRLIEAAKVKNIPIVFVNRNPFFNVGDGQPADNCWVVSSNSIKEGAVGMEYVGEKLGGKGNVVILMGMLGQEAATNRTEGVRQVIREKYPEIKVLASETGNWFRDQGMSVMENYITAYGDQINAVCSNNDEMAIGAALALQANGMRDKVLVVGVDGTRDGVQAIETGLIDASAYQDPVAQGAGSVDIAIAVLRGENPERRTLLPVEAVTRENLSRFKK